MAKRKPKPRVFDQNGQDLGAWYDPTSWGAGLEAAAVEWQPTSDPDVMRAFVPNNTPRPAEVLSWTIDYPQPGTTVWYRPTQAALISGRAQAAIETVQATAESVAQTGGQLLNVAGTIGQNLVPILIGLAALYLIATLGKFR